MAASRRSVSRRDLFGELFRLRREEPTPRPDEDARLSEHSQQRVQELLERLQQQNRSHPTAPEEDD